MVISLPQRLMADTGQLERPPGRGAQLNFSALVALRGDFALKLPYNGGLIQKKSKSHQELNGNEKKKRKRKEQIIQKKSKRKTLIMKKKQKRTTNKREKKQHRKAKERGGLVGERNMNH